MHACVYIYAEKHLPRNIDVLIPNTGAVLFLHVMPICILDLTILPALKKCVVGEVVEIKHV